jgi:hypothetical protein
MGESEEWNSPQREQEDSMGVSGAWEGLIDRGESSMDWQDGWVGFPG